jgi:hypothetical protein
MVSFAIEGEIEDAEVKTNATEILIKFPNSISISRYLIVIFHVHSPPIPTGQAEFKVNYLDNLGEIVTQLEPANVDSIPNNNNSLTVTVLPNQNNAAIEVVPSVQNTEPFKPFEVLINIKDIQTEIPDAFFAFQFDFSFDPNIAFVTNIEEGDFLSKSGSNTFWGKPDVDNVEGRVKNVMGSILGNKGVSGEGTLAIITLEALNDGTSPITLENVLLTDIRKTSLRRSRKAGRIHLHKDFSFHYSDCQ